MALLESELRRTMALSGSRRVDEITSDLVEQRRSAESGVGAVRDDLEDLCLVLRSRVVVTLELVLAELLDHPIDGTGRLRFGESQVDEFLNGTLPGRRSCTLRGRQPVPTTLRASPCRAECESVLPVLFQPSIFLVVGAAGTR